MEGGWGEGWINTHIQYVDSCCTFLTMSQFRARPHSGSSVEHLEQRLDDLETLRKYCGSKMDSQIGKGEYWAWHGIHTVT